MLQQAYHSARIEWSYNPFPKVTYEMLTLLNTDNSMEREKWFVDIVFSLLIIVVQQRLQLFANCEVHQHQYYSLLHPENK